MDCFGTYLTHAQSCDNVRVHSATQWTASVHTLHMPKAVITFMFKVLQEGLLRYIHMPKAVITFMFKVYGLGCFGAYFTHAQSCDKVLFEVYGMDCWRTYLTHAHICDNVRVQSTTEWIVFSPFSCFRRFRDFAFSFFPVSVLGVFAFSRFRVPPAASPRPGHRFRVHRKFFESSAFQIVDLTFHCQKHLLKTQRQLPCSDGFACLRSHPSLVNCTGCARYLTHLSPNLYTKGGCARTTNLEQLPATMV